MERCDGCGFEYEIERFGDAPAAIATAAAQLAATLISAGSYAAQRQSRDEWSPLEYGCHVRDVLIVQRERALAALREDRPTSTPMGRDERAEHDGYRDQHPDDVARQLNDAAMLLLNVFGRLDDEQWDRTLVYTYPEVTERSLRWLAVHTRHELEHHLLDVQRQLR